jgi:hypothetical protein
MWSARAYEAKRVCLGVKHTFTNRRECKGWSPMTPKCTSILGITFVWESQTFRTLVGKTNKHQIGPHDTIEKVLRCRCLKCSCIVHLDLICMNYDEKKGQESNWKFHSQSQIPLKQGSNDFRLGHAIQLWKDHFEGYKIVPSHAPNRLDLSKIWTSKVFGQQRSQFGSLRKKCHLDVTPIESHRAYEGSDASSQRLQVV